jgi:ATP-grasp domain
VTFGPGAAPDGRADLGARLAPLTDTDAEELIGSIAPRGAPPPDLAAVREMLLRVSRLADDLPEVAELDLSSVTARADGVRADGARIRLTPSQAHDPLLRKLL